MKVVYFPRATFQFFSSFLKRTGHTSHHEKKALYLTVGLIGGSWTLLLLDTMFTNGRISANSEHNRWHAFRNKSAQEDLEKFQLQVSKQRQLYEEKLAQQGK